MNANLTQEQVEKLEDLYEEHLFHRKYLVDPQSWNQIMLDRAILLKMQNSPHKLWCLDIGCAVPYFGRVVSEVFGHDIINIDTDTKVLQESAKILKCDFLSHTITEDIYLPELPYKFDLITIFGVNLHGNDYYGEFMKYVFSLLVPNGRLIVAPNIGYLDNIWEKDSWWFKFIPEVVCYIQRLSNMITITKRG